MFFRYMFFISSDKESFQTYIQTVTESNRRQRKKKHNIMYKPLSPKDSL